MVDEKPKETTRTAEDIFEKYFPFLKMTYQISLDKRTVDYAGAALAARDSYWEAVEESSGAQKRRFDKMLWKRGIDTSLFYG